MKNIKIYFIIYLLIFYIQDVNASIGVESTVKSDVGIQKTNSSKIDSLNTRRLEIKNLDKSSFTNSQKKALRQESQAIKKEQVHGGGGIYLSLSAIVIGLLLLIILL
jgi:hypothetical protein